jgi:hypothetical protein
VSAYLTWIPKSGRAKSLYFDAVTDEGQTLTSTVTEHPVEEGPNVADHLRKDLDSVTLEVFVSNSPVYDVNSRGGKVVPVELKIEKYSAPLEPTPGSVFNAVGGAISSLFSGEDKYVAQVMKFDEEFDAVGDTLALLRGIRSTAQLVTVVLPSKLYADMALVKIEMRRSRASGDGAVFALEFREVQKVKVSIVAAPSPTEPRAKPKVKKGPLDPKDAAAGAKKKSLLKALLG